MRFRILLTLLLSLGAMPLIAYPQGSENNIANVVKRTSDAVVQVVISDANGKETALGSGFIISAEGRIVTNYHVIKDAYNAIVELANGAFFPVDGVLAADADKDLAILKVSGKNLPYLELGDNRILRVGEHVIAIGSPLGLEGTVSDGIVSAIRELAGQSLIQTTAPVTHGNSGGPLLDLNGHVVGVITGGFDPGPNLNFAVPAESVKSLLTNVHAPIPLETVKEMQAKAKEPEDNKKAGEASLTENGKKDGVVTLPSGLQYKIIKAGQGQKPTDADTVTCNYRGTLIDGTEFDKSKPGQPATFQVSAVISGVRELLKLMPVDSTWQFFIPPQLAYGERGAGNVVPPNATLIFEVELLSIKQNASVGPAATETQAPDAQYNLGVKYYHGDGVPRDYQEAVKWFHLAADQGYSSAQVYLGLMFERGEGVPQDYQEAVKWFHLAASQGDSLAASSLGGIYERGEEGVPQDYVRALMWYNLAAASGDAAFVQDRDRLREKMTPMQIAEAQRLYIRA